MADPDRSAYAAYGLIEGGAKEFLNGATARAYLRSFAGGARGGRPIGNPSELGGAFVIDHAGTVVLAHPARYAGDSPTIEDLLAAVAAVPLPAAPRG